MQCFFRALLYLLICLKRSSLGLKTKCVISSVNKHHYPLKEGEGGGLLCLTRMATRSSKMRFFGQKVCFTNLEMLIYLIKLIEMATSN